MMKLSKKSLVKNNMLSDLKRAAFVCTTQAFLYLMFDLLGLSQQITYNLITVETNYKSLIKTYLAISLYEVVFFELAVVIDCLAILFVLKSYRKIVIGAFLKVLKKIHILIQ